MSNAINQGQGEAREKPPALSAVRRFEAFRRGAGARRCDVTFTRAKFSRWWEKTGPGSRRSFAFSRASFAPDLGEIFARGVRQVLRSPADAHALGIHVIHQEPDIVPDLTIAENLFLGDFKRVGGVFLDRADLVERTRVLFAEFGLEEGLGPWVRAGDLRPAQRQLMEIMRALRGGLRVLALDEPTSSLTVEEAQRLFLVVRRLRDDGVGRRLHLSSYARGSRSR